MDQEYMGVQLAWKRIIAIAKNLPDPIDVKYDETVHLHSEEENDLAYKNRLYAMSNSLQNMFIITSQEEGYIAFMLTLVRELNYDCPTSLAYMKHMIDYSDIPSQQALESLSHLLVHQHDQLECPMKINQFIVWSTLAQKFAGNLSQAMWIDSIFPILLKSLAESSQPSLQLYALIVIESFSLNGHLKNKFLSWSLDRILVQTVKQITKKDLAFNPLVFKTSRSSISDRKILLGPKIKKDTWIADKELLFSLNWSLSHIFTKDDLSKNQKEIFNFINPRHHCKISQDGLEIRNDTQFFESFYMPIQLNSGKWYYEIILLTSGIVQIGWCSKDYTSSDKDTGIGNDDNGFAFDTYQCGVWMKGEIKRPKQNTLSCSKGDVVGCLIDFEKNKCIYSVNGKDYSLQVQLGDRSKEGVLPIICITNHQHIIVNIGNRPWLYKPSHTAKPIKFAFKSEKRSSRLSFTRRESDSSTEEIDDDPLCIICFEEKKDTLFSPCNHDGFCKQCSKSISLCPLCRTPIEEKIYKN